MDPEWLTEAHRRFGDHKEVFDYVETPHSMWANLRDVFSAAYTYPYHEADIRAIYEYAEWSCKQPRGESATDDLLTVVAVGFYKHVPQVAAPPRYPVLSIVCYYASCSGRWLQAGWGEGA